MREIKVVLHPESVLLITLDSCRFDSFAAAAAPHMRAVGALRRAKAPGHFTYGSHAAMFVGFTPSVPGLAQPFLDNKFAKLFKLHGGGWHGASGAGFDLAGGSVMQGFKKLGYRVWGTGAAAWFDPATETGALLTRDFESFYYAGATWHLRAQMEWLQKRLVTAAGVPVFAFVNVGETHVPYYFEGAAWDRTDNPCLPYQTIDRAAECRTRQIACVEFSDAMLASVLTVFAGATIMICADHGDCWGEDGLWEHGVSHEMTLSVPLLMRVRGVAI